MAATRRIGILTGGGDVPGLNSVIKSVVYRSAELGYEVLGIRRGWEGLTHLRPGAQSDRDYVRPLDRDNTRTIDRTGGTRVHTSRTNSREMHRGTLPAWLSPDQLESLAVGGDPLDPTPISPDHIRPVRHGLLRTIPG